MDNYEINSETLLIIPFARGKSKVYEVSGEYIVNKIPLDIIKDSCLFFGSSFEGRKAAVKDMLSIDMKVPIVIEDSRNMIFFPTGNCINNNSIWVSYQNLLRYTKFDDLASNLYFKGHKSVVVDVKCNLIDNQMIRCAKLKDLLERRKALLNDDCLTEEGIFL